MLRLQESWLIVGLLVILPESGLLQAQDALQADRREKDLETIRQCSRDFVAAFDRADAKAVAALWTEDGDYLDDTGSTFAGRDAIQKEYARFLPPIAA